MPILPGGFSPLRAIQQVGSYVNPTGGVADYDVFSNYSVEGGARNPVQTSGNVLGVNYGPQNGPSPYIEDTQPLVGGGTSTSNLPNTGPYGGGGDAAARAARAAAAQRASNVNFVNQAFDTKLARLRGQLSSIDPQQQASERQINSQYDIRFGDLNTGLGQGKRNLEYSRNQVKEGRERGLKSLRDQLSQQAMSYGAQLGAYGAGDSSATNMINFALAGQASRNRGDVMGNASKQETEIGMQEQDLLTSYEQNKRDLDNWKQSTLGELATKFAEQRNAIEAEMKYADAQRQQQLAEYNAALTQSAIDRLSDIENMFTRQSGEIASRYQNMFVPQNIQMNPALQQYQTQAINEGRIAGLNMPNAVNPEAEYITALRRRDEEQLQNPLGL